MERTLTHAADVIQREHRSLLAVVHCLDTLVREIRDGKAEPDFGLFHAILEYIEDFPDQFHHPKEDRFLFERLYERDPDSRPRIDEMKAEHLDGERRKRDLETKLKAWEKAPESKVQSAAFLDAAQRYVDFQRRHVRVEEQDILPAARKHLSEEDWRVITEAFNDHEDLLFGDQQQDRFKSLLSRIAALAPEPLGFAPRKAPKRSS